MLCLQELVSIITTEANHSFVSKTSHGNIHHTKYSCTLNRGSAFSQDILSGALNQSCQSSQLKKINRTWKSCCSQAQTQDNKELLLLRGRTGISNSKRLQSQIICSPNIKHLQMQDITRRQIWPLMNKFLTNTAGSLRPVCVSRKQVKTKMWWRFEMWA